MKGYLFDVDPPLKHRRRRINQEHDDGHLRLGWAHARRLPVLGAQCERVA